MWKLGLESAPHDLDVMTDAEHFPVVSARISQMFGPGQAAPHPRYRSGFFRPFNGRGVPVDLMADVRVQTVEGLVSWDFDTESIAIDDGLL